MLDQREHAVEIDSDGAAPLRVGHLLNGSIFWRPYSVVRDQNIKPPKTLNGSFDQFLRCPSAGKIAVDGRTVLFAQFFDQPFRLRLGFSVIEPASSPRCHERP